LAWIGSGKSKRVIRMDTGEVFSCVYSIAYVLRVESKAIFLCCEKYIPTVKGIRLEWLEQFLHDHPEKADFPKYRVPKPIRIKKPKEIEIPKGYNSQGNLRKYNLGFLKLMTEFLDHVLKDQETISLSCYELEVGFVEFVRQKRPLFKTSASGISRHLLNKKDIYEKTYGMEVSEGYSVESRKNVNLYKFHRAENGSNLVETRAYNFRFHKTGTFHSRNGKPVIRMRDKMIFSSIRMASKLTSISANKIRWCCEGDIPAVKLFAGEEVFRYVEFR